MKKYLLAALLFVSAVNFYAADFNQDGLYYNIKSLTDLTVELVAPDYGHYNGNITVPRTVEYLSRTFKVTGINSEAFSGCDIATLSIQDNIISVGNLNFGNVKEFRIEDGDEPLKIEKDKEYWYWNNYEDMSVYIGRDISPDMNRLEGFKGMSGATAVEFGSKVTEIPRDLFWECNTLATVIIPDNVKTIGSYAFEGTSISSIQALGVTTIGSGAFEDCDKLKQAKFSEALEEINGYAFYSSAIEEFILPANSHALKLIDYHAFDGCTSLKSFVIPEGVCYLGYFAFSGCTSLETVKIPNSVYDFGNFSGEYDNRIGNVFKGCSALKTIIVGHEAPVKIWENTFDAATYISATLKVPAGTKDKYLSADNWKNFFNIEEDATIADNICTVGISVDKYSYGGEVSVEAIGGLGEWYDHQAGQNLIVAPKGAKIKLKIGPYDSYKLTSLLVNGEEVISAVVRNEYVMEVTGTMELKIIPTYEYYYYQTIRTEEASFKEQADGSVGITEVEDGVKEYAIPETVADYSGTTYTVASIENSAFEDNSELTSVSIPATITYIDDHAFAGCTNLEAIYVYSEEPIELPVASHAVEASRKAPRSEAADSEVDDIFVFEGVNKESCKLYVPKGCVEKYRNAAGWNEFKQILEINTTGIESVISPANSNSLTDKAWYTLDGRQLHKGQYTAGNGKLSKGIYISRGKKVVVK